MIEIWNPNSKSQERNQRGPFLNKPLKTTFPTPKIPINPFRIRTHLKIMKQHIIK